MKILIATSGPLTYSMAPSSRLIYIAKSLKKKGFTVELVGGKGEKINNLKIATVTGNRQILRLKVPFLFYKKATTQKCNHKHQLNYSTVNFCDIRVEEFSSSIYILNVY